MYFIWLNANVSFSKIINVGPRRSTKQIQQIAKYLQILYRFMSCIVSAKNGKGRRIKQDLQNDQYRIDRFKEMITKKDYGRYFKYHSV